MCSKGMSWGIYSQQDTGGHLDVLQGCVMGYIYIYIYSQQEIGGSQSPGCYWRDPSKSASNQ